MTITIIVTILAFLVIGNGFISWVILKQSKNNHNLLLNFVNRPIKEERKIKPKVFFKDEESEYQDELKRLSKQQKVLSHGQ